MKIDVGVMGVTGYAGRELVRILLNHPHVQLRYLASRQISHSQPAGELIPSFRFARELKVHPFKLKEALKACELFFLTLPNGLAMGLAPAILKKSGTKVIDLSSDFRLKKSRGTVYGLTEYAREAVPSARLVANPGCYPTAILLGTLPLAFSGLLRKEGLIADVKSGVTGAGRGLKEELLFCEVNEDLRAYRVNAHPHIPEIEEQLRLLSGRGVKIVFVPHLVPLNRGLYATLYAPLTKKITEGALRAIYENRYRKEPFVRLLPEGKFPQVKSVAGTNGCEIGLRLDAKKNLAIVLVAIDNLGKGAAGQAVQNMNLLYGFEETVGLLA